RDSCGWSDARAPRSWLVRCEGSGSMREAVSSLLSAAGFASGFFGGSGLRRPAREFGASFGCSGTSRASNACSAASLSASRRARRDVNCSSAILTPVQLVFRDVLHYAVRYEVPDGCTIHHPLSAIRGRYRQRRDLHETQPIDRQPLTVEFVTGPTDPDEMGQG